MLETRCPFCAGGLMNIDDYVWVKLTPAGHKVVGEKTFQYKDAGNGWSRWQLWILMQMFGEHIYMGNPKPCFENEILLTAPNKARTGLVASSRGLAVEHTKSDSTSPKKNKSKTATSR